MKPLTLSSLLLLLPLPTLAATRFQNDFSSYPSGSVDCLYKSDNSSGCNGATVTLMNACLCANGGNFVTNTAKCMLEAGTTDDLSATYSVLKVNCQGTSTGLTVSEADFMTAGGVSGTTSAAVSAAGVSGTATASKTGSIGTGSATTSTSTATTIATATSKSKTLSPTTIAAIGAGLGVAGLFALGLTSILLLRRHRQQKKQQHQQQQQQQLLPRQESDYLKPPGTSSGYSVTSPIVSPGAWDPTMASAQAPPNGMPAAYLGAPPGYQWAGVGRHPDYGDVKDVNGGVPVEMPAQTVVYELDSTSVERGVGELVGSGEMVHPRVKEKEELREKTWKRKQDAF